MILYILNDISPTHANVSRLATLEAVEQCGDAELVAYCPPEAVVGQRVRLAHVQVISDPIALLSC